MNNAKIADHDSLVAVPAHDRRQSKRALTVYKVVKVERKGKEGLARCRNVSDSGMKLEVGIPVSLNDELLVELAPQMVLHTRVVWTNGNECGVAFYRNIDCTQLLGQSAELKQQETMRSPRLNSQIPAKIVAEGEVLPTTIKNISQRGMMVTHGGDFRAGMRIKVIMQNGQNREALVRWTHENFAGLLLADPYSVMELSNIQSIG